VTHKIHQHDRKSLFGRQLLKALCDGVTLQIGADLVEDVGLGTDDLFSFTK
jgi:hypothetical protein